MNATMKLHATSEILATLILSLLTLQSGCNLIGFDGDAVSASWDTPFLLTEGARTTLPDSVQLEFVDAQDSRCPLDVTCVWEGEVQVDLRLHRPNGTMGSVLLRGYVDPEGDDPLVKDTLGYRIGLLRLDPYPRTDLPEEIRHVGTFEVGPSTP